MSRVFSLLPAGLIASLVVMAAFGYIAYEGSNQGRTYALWNDAYKTAKNQGEEKLDQLFLEKTARSELVFPALTEPKQIEEYKAAKNSIQNLDQFFYKNVLPAWWLKWLFLLALIPAGIICLYVVRPVFQKQAARMLFINGLLGLCGGYFWHLQTNNIYPLGIDLAGGTELIYSLDYREIDRRIEAQNARIDELKDRQAKKQRDNDGTDITEEKISAAVRVLQSLKDSKQNAPTKATDIVRKRVDPTGAKGVPVTSYDQGQRIRIQLPKASPEQVDQIKRQIKTGGRLTFHVCTDDRSDIQRVEGELAAGKHDTVLMKMEIEKPDYYDPTKKRLEDTVYAEIEPMLEGSRIINSRVSRGDDGYWEVLIYFDAAGEAQFADVTGKNIGKKMAIVLDGKGVTAPVIRSRINGTCQITGSFTEKDAKELASILQAGSLPVDVEMESTLEIGPSLGGQQIQSGIFATVIGAVTVALFMLIYYRLAGIVAIIGMATLLILMLGSLGFFKATMTLPGIAGILLNLGMAVDANVLIYERIREELSRGRPFRLAVQHGFDRAFLTIIDCHITTLISAVILYYVGTGPVRGFAIVLSIGVLVTLFSNVWVTRQVMEWLVSREAVQSLNMMQLFRTTNFDFMGTRRIWIASTAFLAVVSLAAFIYMGPVTKRIYDVDFTGGTLVVFNFSKGQEQTSEEVKGKVEKDLKANLKLRVQHAVEKLRAVSTSADAEKKTGLALYDQIKADDPSLAQQLGRPENLTGPIVKNLADDLAKVLDDYDRTPFVGQSFGQPIPGSKTNYRSFTVTTRISESKVMSLLDDELKKLFEGKLEPRAVEVSQETAKLRFDGERVKSLNAEDKVAAIVREHLQGAAKDSNNEDIKTALAALKVSEVKTETYGSGSGFARPYVDIGPLPTDASQRERVIATLELTPVKLKGNETDLKLDGPISRTSSFGKQVSGEMFLYALLALIGSMIGIFIYLWFRFEFTGAWGFGAIVALIHDGLIAIGALCLANAFDLVHALVNLDVVAAVLTVIGYSVNDTIVVFDRIREVKHAHPTRKLDDIVNEAVNATLSRTVLTAFTAIVATLALLLFGGETVQGLAFVLFFGFVVGMYSSIFIASPLMIWWYNKFGQGSVAKALESKPKEKSADPEEERAPSGAQV